MEIQVGHEMTEAAVAVSESPDYDDRPIAHHTFPLGFPLCFEDAQQMHSTESSAFGDPRRRMKRPMIPRLVAEEEGAVMARRFWGQHHPLRLQTRHIPGKAVHWLPGSQRMTHFPQSPAALEVGAAAKLEQQYCEGVVRVGVQMSHPLPQACGAHCSAGRTRASLGRRRMLSRAVLCAAELPPRALLLLLEAGCHLRESIRGDNIEMR